ncbi:hypothetical protein [Paraburkholderia sp. JPY419]|uniref:hypothetical protein n=1 Tax=Paraburkholderia sp. JPY419 TaxID=667660 RepID=UPI003D1B2218
MVTSGPGATHAVTPIADCRLQWRFGPDDPDLRKVPRVAILDDRVAGGRPQAFAPRAHHDAHIAFSRGSWWKSFVPSRDRDQSGGTRAGDQPASDMFQPGTSARARS